MYPFAPVFGCFVNIIAVTLIGQVIEFITLVFTEESPCATFAIDWSIRRD
jgi:hypothetical protein